jgi:COMPASS component SPP1
MDELIEQERQIKQAMSSRSGLMGLLLHSTFDHTMAARLQQATK